MVDVNVNNTVISFDTIASVRLGLARRGNMRLAAIAAAGRLIYPDDRRADHAEIVEIISAIGHDTQCRDVWLACVQSLFAMDILAYGALQANPPAQRVVFVNA